MVYLPRCHEMFAWQALPGCLFLKKKSSSILLTTRKNFCGPTIKNNWRLAMPPGVALCTVWFLHLITNLPHTTMKNSIYLIALALFFVFGCQNEPTSPNTSGPNVPPPPSTNPTLSVTFNPDPGVVNEQVTITGSVLENITGTSAKVQLFQNLKKSFLYGWLICVKLQKLLRKIW